MLKLNNAPPTGSKNQRCERVRKQKGFKYKSLIRAVLPLWGSDINADYHYENNCAS